MMIVQYETCTGCGNEIEMLTDGREIEIAAMGVYYEDICPDDVEIANAGAFYVSCPVVDVRVDERCPGIVEFTGEGVETDRPLTGSAVAIIR